MTRYVRSGTNAGYLPEQVACLWMPQFAVRVERLRRADLPPGPLALIGSPEHGSSPVILACCALAAAAGLWVGGPAQTVSQRCPQAVILPYDGPHYRQRYEALLQRLDALTPQVEPSPLEVCYLDLSGLPGLDPWDAERVAALLEPLVPPSFAPRLGIASGKFGAWVAANHATPVRPLALLPEQQPLLFRDAPAGLLPVAGETARQLELLGLRTLGRIVRMRRSALLARFGAEGERLHRLASGEETEPFRPFRPATVIRESVTFPASAPTTSHFYLGLAGLLQRLWLRPERGVRPVRQVRLEAATEEGGAWERAITLRSPSERWELAFAELQRRLEGLLPRGSLTQLTAELTAFTPQVDRQPLLFPNHPQERRERLRQEVDQLRYRSRLGGRAPVQRIVEVDPWTLLPEERYGLIAFND